MIIWYGSLNRLIQFAKTGSCTAPFLAAPYAVILQLTHPILCAYKQIYNYSSMQLSFQLDRSYKLIHWIWITSRILSFHPERFHLISCDERSSKNSRWSGNLLISPSFLRNDFSGCRFTVDWFFVCFSFHHLEYTIPLPSGHHDFWWEIDRALYWVFLVSNESLLSCCFQEFFLPFYDQQYTMIRLGVVFEFILVKVCWTS